jgi:hypothetical protein
LGYATSHSPLYHRSDTRRIRRICAAMPQLVGLYSCSGCDYGGLETHRPVVVRYEVGLDRWFESVPASGWCPDCGAIVDLERIESLESVQRRIDEAASALPRWLLGTWQRALAQVRADQPRTWSAPDQSEAELRAEWRSQRRNPARCLACGSNRATPVLWAKAPTDDAGTDAGDCYQSYAPHGCGGRLRLCYPAAYRGVSYAMRPLRFVVSREGALLRTENLD